MAASIALYGAWQMAGWPRGHTELISDLSFAPLSAAAAYFAWSASRRGADDPRVRWAWRLIALACASYGAGDLTWMAYSLQGKSPYPSAADGFYLLFYPLLLLGLLRLSARGHSRAAAIRLGLDVAVVTVGGSTLVVYLVLGPTIASAGTHSLATVFSIAYPVGDMILLLGLGSVLLRGSPGPVLRLLAAGLVCFVAADLAFAYISLHGTYSSGNSVDALWMAAMALFAIAAATAERGPSAEPEQAREEIRSASWLPYVALAATFGLLVVDEFHDSLSGAFLLVLSSVLVASIVSVRQFLTQRDLLQVRRQLRFDSLHDGLTGLANRALLAEQAEQMLARARRHGRGVGVLYVDVDDFKAINDGLGHTAGDEVLRAVATRLSTLLRASDVVGRLGGDEFVVLLDEVTGAEQVRRVAQRIGRLFEVPIESEALGDTAVVATLSVGVAVEREGTVDDLLRDADAAMYEVKRSRKRTGRAPSATRSRAERLPVREGLPRTLLARSG
jgi:diguanylate cyclase (GGDEF)-like protein